MGGVSSGQIFRYLFFLFEKNMSLTPLKLPKHHFKTNFFFNYLGEGTLLSYDCSHMGGLNFKPVAILQLSDDPYHKEFVS